MNYYEWNLYFTLGENKEGKKIYCSPVLVRCVNAETNKFLIRSVYKGAWGKAFPISDAIFFDAFPISLEAVTWLRETKRSAPREVLRHLYDPEWVTDWDSMIIPSWDPNDPIEFIRE